MISLLSIRVKISVLGLVEKESVGKGWAGLTNYHGLKQEQAHLHYQFRVKVLLTMS